MKGDICFLCIPTAHSVCVVGRICSVNFRSIFSNARKARRISLTLQAAEQTVKHQDSRNRQNCLRGELGVG